ncbi:pyruvate:ferredoxin (flavodoxin) oxidoreductase [Dubosiella newyorkensis]|uniref:Pyruvate:ferredoxin (Flavodoxin) oxidoreductase n=2 Tax=Dubosiella newyorkensis TaxID=1862672 RepID=A0A1U7NL78_9FIRM|nr:pyruvate:ferredoxin (flavodoxin) oxidoreductase [Dubosiella newyorkensis]MCI9040636.1 pyruvate:ferredoxin (flavodoxin) oxidoreductase [Dubosiella newyorkensis]OLU45353.1 pyruvate:ferredoxin (flavodoxin) oxidoreductase [Dubosiella newyorkensis]
MAKHFQSMDGNTATAHNAYALAEMSCIYPITPSSPMAEVMDVWASQGRKNAYGEVVKIAELQSEAGASGAVHGAAQAGVLPTTFTASQGLLLMIPNIYKWVGENLPVVLHVAARSLASRSLNIFGDHEDVYAVRQTGIPMLSSHSVQEAMDLAGIAHLAAIKCHVPFLHFHDGFRTSHEVDKIEVFDTEKYKELIDWEALDAFRKNAMQPHTNPVTRGANENDDIFFQGVEARNKHYENIPDVVADYMKQISEITGRDYKPFNYVGAPDAERVIVAMGSVTETATEVVEDLMKNGEKIGLIKVHLYRPFSTKYLTDVLPKTVKKIAVLDRTKEGGASGDPLYLDVLASLKDKDIEIVGGRYGLGSHDTEPNQIKAVFDELKKDEPKNGFTVGIEDDVTFTSLPIDKSYKIDSDATECLFWGLGSDGTVSANKSSIKIIGDNTDMFAQGYYAYDSKKAGGVTRSHLRFGNSPIHSTYYINNADFISCSLDSYMFKYDLARNLKQGGTFLLNTTFTPEEIVKHMPNRLKKELADKDAKFYIIDATKIAENIGMGRRTNTILQSAFFALNPQIMPLDKAVELMKAAAKKSYGKKGDAVVELNYKAIDAGKDGLVEIPVDKAWSDLPVSSLRKETGDPYWDEYAARINHLEGYDMPVSAFTKNGVLDGTMQNGIAFKEKRTIATNVPQWNPDNCIQCGFCSFVCPHATIRTFALTPEEIANAPKEFEGFATLPLMGKPNTDLRFRVQVSPSNCVGCGLCANECPGKAGKKALTMVDVNSQLYLDPLADYLYKETEYKTDLFPKTTIKGSQFQMPYFEVPGSCPGCGETPYYRLASQLFGKDMQIANATGCSSIYCGANPSTPFVKDKDGNGTAWANSLFEDNAEFGYGMALANNYTASKVYKIMEDNLDKVTPELKDLFEQYLAAGNDREKQRELAPKIKELVATADVEEDVKTLAEYDLVHKSNWIIGGDGWAYDIGYGGLDHVLANNVNVNVLVLDTEVYSNTGGQSSKSSQRSSVAKFAAGGKTTAKKDLGQIAMTYGHVYVAQVCMGADKMQTLKAFQEAESYDGPSLIIAYAPCVEHGIKGGLGNHQQVQREAVECGYVDLYRYDPRKEQPLTIDSKKEPNYDKMEEFMLKEARFAQLVKLKGPEASEKMFEKAKADAKARRKRLQAIEKEGI